MTVTVRFAPSPTGFLHIGGARTALFNYLFARHHQGQFLLRIEDTDKARSTQAAIDAIHDGLNWLGLIPDMPPVLQSQRIKRHREVVNQLVENGKAYRCYMTAEELATEREAAQARGEVYKYDRRWRDRSPEEAPIGITPSIRLKAPLEGSIIIDDAVQGKVEVAYDDLDDMILMRSDDTPTYLLAVVVDDYDMGITHIIRGDDHFTNSFRQAMIYNALGWPIPAMAHVPLIHGQDGAKLSKRHGALGVDAYREMGYLPEAVRNYLLRLGWSHGDDEIIDDTQAVAWFNLGGLGKSPARFDMVKLNSLNAHYIRQASSERIASLIQPFVEKALQRLLKDHEIDMLQLAVPELQARASTLKELADNALFYFGLPTSVTPQAAGLIEENKQHFAGIYKALSGLTEWKSEAIQSSCAAYGEAHGLKLGKVMNPLRAAITGSHASPSMFHVMVILGKEESLRRISLHITDQ